MSETAARIVVSGRVQGVGFRAWTAAQARALELRGYVRNLENGDVEVVAEGAPPAVERLIEQLGQGPRLARVSGVHAAPIPCSGLFRDFSPR